MSRSVPRSALVVAALFTLLARCWGQPAEGSCVCLTGNGVNIRSSACGSLIGQANRGDCYVSRGRTQRCSLGGQSYSYWQVSYNGQSGWIASNFLSPSGSNCPGACVCVTGSTLNVRNSACGGKIGTVTNGDCFVSQAGSQSCAFSSGGTTYIYWQVDYQGQSAWMANNWLAVSIPSRCQGAVGTSRCYCTNAENHNVRNTPCGSKIGQLTRGGCVSGKERTMRCAFSSGGTVYTFRQVEYNGQTGWMADDWLQASPDSSCSTSRPAPGPAPAGCSGAHVVSRSAWGARNPRGVSVLRTPVPRVFIHHSEGAACTSESSCKSVVKGIQRYHMDNNGWADIGYNFLVGGDGQAYEGRGWSVKGAHAREWNPTALGICMIGSFTSETPRQVALDTVRNLIQCGVDLGYVSPSYTLHGHRDGVSTSCPGNALYRLLQGWPHFAGPLN